MRSVLTANQIIDESLAGVRDFDRKYYDEAAMYFLRGYREFKLFHAGGEVKEAWKPVSQINTVEFPEDSLRVIEIGIVSDGEFFPFTRTDKLRGVSDPDDETLSADRGETDTLNRTPNYGYGAKGANVEYYYREDRENRRFFLSRLAIDRTLFADRQEVLIRYVSNGLEDFDHTYIAADAANLLIAYIEYKIVSSRPDKYDARYRDEKREDYNAQWRMYDTLELPSLTELADVIFETSSQNIRRV